MHKKRGGGDILSLSFSSSFPPFPISRPITKEVNISDPKAAGVGGGGWEKKGFSLPSFADVL